jgi:hypothetical protein
VASDTARVSPLRQALDVIMGPGELDALVRLGRLRGRSWRALALEVRDRTRVDVTHETLRNWYLDLELDDDDDDGEPAA